MREPIGPAVWALDRRGLARPQVGFDLGLERHAGEGDKQHDHARVHDVAAVAPAVAGDQPAERQRIALPVLAVAGAGPPGGNGKGHARKPVPATTRIAAFSFKKKKNTQTEHYALYASR